MKNQFYKLSLNNGLPIRFFKSTYNKNSQLTERELIHIMTKRVDLLIIDDLGNHIK